MRAPPGHPVVQPRPAPTHPFTLLPVTRLYAARSDRDGAGGGLWAGLTPAIRSGSLPRLRAVGVPFPRTAPGGPAPPSDWATGQQLRHVRKTLAGRAVVTGCPGQALSVTRSAGFLRAVRPSRPSSAPVKHGGQPAPPRPHPNARRPEGVGERTVTRNPEMCGRGPAGSLI